VRVCVCVCPQRGDAHSALTSTQVLNEDQKTIFGRLEPPALVAAALEKILSAMVT
jgi:hypothetical protein